MSLLNRIDTDHKAARRHGDDTIADALKMVLAINNRTKRLTRTPDREVQAIVQGLIHQFDRWLLEIAPEKRGKLARQQEQLRRYLPLPLTDHELEEIAVRQNRIMNPTQIKDFLKRNYNGRYDPIRADRIVREVTSS